MDALWIKANMMFFVLSLLSCSQANPVLKNYNADDMVETGLKQNLVNLATENNDRNEEHTHSTRNNDAKNNNKDNQNDKVKKENTNNNPVQINSLSKPAHTFQQGAAPAGSFPFPESLPISEVNGKDGGQPNQASKEFTKKVLQAFFAELKNRPELVDEILRRETYKLLLNIAQEDTEFNSLSPDVDLTHQVAAPGQGAHAEDPGTILSGGTKTNAPGKTDADQKGISKKASTQDANVNGGGLKTLSSLPTEDSSVSEASKLQAALAKELDNIGQSGLTPKMDTSNADEDNSASPEQLLIDPYYYYVYYDENEDPSDTPVTNGSQSASVAENSNSDVKPKMTDNNDVNGDDNNNNIINNKSGRNSNPSDAGMTQDIVIDKIASAMKSVIARDMENQLAKSKLSAQLYAANSNHQVLLPQAGVNVALPDVVKGSGVKSQQTEEEKELTNLTQ